MEDHLEHVDGHQFDVTDFIKHPENYRSTFYERVLAYLSLDYQLIWITCRYFLTLPVLLMVSTGLPALPGFLLSSNVNSCKQKNWACRSQEHRLFLNVFWPFVIFQLT